MIAALGDPDELCDIAERHFLKPASPRALPQLQMSFGLFTFDGGSDASC